MKAKSTSLLPPQKNVLHVAQIIGAILLIPVFGNMFISGWNWGVLDFIVMGGLLFLTGLAIDFAARKLINLTVRVAVIVAIVLALLAIWIELATDGVSRNIQQLVAN